MIEYSIRETYYNSKDKIWAISSTGDEVYTAVELDSSPHTPNPIKEMEEIIERMKLALTRPIVDLDTIKFAPRHYNNEEEGYRR